MKVISAVRRREKSCFLENISLKLRESGVHEETIIYLNLDERGYINIRTARCAAKKEFCSLRAKTQRRLLTNMLCENSAYKDESGLLLKLSNADALRL